MDEWWKREEIADGSRGGREFMPEETSIQFKVRLEPHDVMSKITSIESSGPVNVGGGL
jgi:hypothetical protein